MNYVSDPKFKALLSDCKDAHSSLDTKLQKLLDRYQDKGRDPDPIAKGMSWMKTNVKLTVNGSDQTVAELITDGCNMGIKSLNKYLNEYKAADEDSKAIAKKLIRLEEDLASDIREYL